MSSLAYSLTLADGSTWHLQAGAGTEAWLAELAGIMRLKEGGDEAEPQIEGAAISEEGNLLSFSCADPGQPGSGVDETWTQIVNGRPVGLHGHPGGHQFSFALDPQYFIVPEMRYLYMSCVTLPFFFHAIDRGGLPIHAALATWRGHGILIAASGCTGKSTCMRRLPQDGDWRPLSDDLGLLLPDRSGRMHAHPMPTWSDYMIRRIPNTWPVATPVPLAAVFFLEQAPDDAVLPLSRTETMVRLYESAKQGWPMAIPPAQVLSRFPAMLNNAATLVRDIPGYRLRATLDGRFWEQIEAVLDRPSGVAVPPSSCSA
jgi:hypothetical protein